MASIDYRTACATDCFPVNKSEQVPVNQVMQNIESAMLDTFAMTMRIRQGVTGQESSEVDIVCPGCMAESVRNLMVRLAAINIALGDIQSALFGNI